LKRAPSENAGPQATPASIRAKKGRATPVEQWHARPCKMKGATKKMWLPGFEPESQHSCLHALASWAELLSRKDSTRNHIY